MTSLTAAIVLMVLTKVMLGQTQNTTESLFLDTTLLPVVELSIKNFARSSTVERDLSSTQEDVVQDQNSLVIAAATQSSDILTTVMELHKNSTISHSVLFHSDLTSEVQLTSPSSSWDASLMPSFTIEATEVDSFTKLIPSTILEDYTGSFSETSAAPVSGSGPLQIDRSLEDGITTPYTNSGTESMRSHMETEVSNSDVHLNYNTAGTETGRKVSTSANVAVVLNEESITPTSWYVFETEPLSHSLEMLPGNQLDEIYISTADVTPTKTEDGGYRSEVVVSDKTQQDQNYPEGQGYIDTLLYYKRLNFVLQSQCDDNILQETYLKLDKRLVAMLSNKIPLNEKETMLSCKRMFDLTVYISNASSASMLKETIQNLTQNFTFGQGLRLKEISLIQNDDPKVVLFSRDSDETVNNFEEYTLSERELIAYIVAGISLGTLIFILLTFCCVRFLCRKQTTSLDLCDIPHLNLKLEDYKLTPIPRPTISFSEYGRELFNPSYNEQTPKLEDTILSQQHFVADTASPGARESMSFPREMRTFGGKKSCNRVQSLDARPNARSGNGWISNSREKLSTDFERRNSGFDNVAFRKWF